MKVAVVKSPTALDCAILTPGGILELLFKTGLFREVT